MMGTVRRAAEAKQARHVSASVANGQMPGMGLELEVAANPFTRARGLLGRRGLPEGVGLWIRPCNSVHMLGMRFAIDVVYLNRDCDVVKVVSHLRPWRMSAGGRRAHSVIELAAGEAERLGIVPGTTIQVQP